MLEFCYSCGKVFLGADNCMVCLRCQAIGRLRKLKEDRVKMEKEYKNSVYRIDKKIDALTEVIVMGKAKA